MNDIFLVLMNHSINPIQLWSQWLSESPVENLGLKLGFSVGFREQAVIESFE